MPRLFPRKKVTCVLLIAVGLLAGVCSRGQVQISTLSDPSTANLGVGSSWAGFVFTTDAQSYSLNQISAPLFLNTGGDTLVAELYATDGSHLPTGSALASFTNSTITGTVSTVTFTPIASIDLSASTQYAFVLHGQSGVGNWEWQATAASGAVSTPAGNTWLAVGGNVNSTDGSNWTLIDSSYFVTAAQLMPLAAVNAAVTAVPEPASAAAWMAGVALLGLMGWRRFGGAGRKQVARGGTH